MKINKPGSDSNQKTSKIKKIDTSKNDSLFENEILNKQIHVICLAVNSLTVFNVYSHILGLSNELATKHAIFVNTKNETGNFFPKYNLTIIPLSDYENRNDFGNRTVFEKHVQDCFDSNEKFIKSPKLIFRIENRGDFDIELFEQVLFEKAEEYDFLHTTEIEYLF